MIDMRLREFGSKGKSNISDFVPNGKFEDLMSRIFCVTDKMATMCQSDAILMFCNIEDREFVPKAIACYFKETKIRLMYGSCAAYVFF